MIRPAKAKDLPFILEVTQSCARHMIANGIFQWNEQYPSVEAFQKDLDREELYVFESQEAYDNFDDVADERTEILMNKLSDLVKPNSTEYLTLTEI